MDSEELKLAITNQKIELWKTTVGTQQHFNTLQLQLRNFVLTLYLAILATVGYTLKEQLHIEIFGFLTSTASLACLAGFVIVFAFYYIDWGYYQLLKGAVSHGHIIEESLRNDNLPEAGQAGSISTSSSAKRFLGIFPKGSSARFHLFYTFLLIGLVATAAFAHFATLPKKTTTTQSSSQSQTFDLSLVRNIIIK